MTCRELAEILIDFVAGELPDHHVQQIEMHLTICEHCSAYVHSYKLTYTLARMLPTRPISPECEKRLRTAVEAACRESGAG